MNLHHNMAGRAVCAVPAGIEIKEAPDSLAEMKAALDSYTRVTTAGIKQFSEHAEKTAGQMNELQARLDTVEQKQSRRAVGGVGSQGDEVKSLGDHVIEDGSFLTLQKNGGRGTARIEIKAITSAANSAGAAVGPDRRDELIALPRRPLRVRSLIAPGQTTSNTVHFLQENVVTNNAAIVPELGLKPESTVTYNSKETSVRTIAHLMTFSRQIMDDAPQLRSIIDTTMTFMLDDVEERQMLLGSGTGDDLLGLVTAATAYDTTENVAGDNPADTIQRAITQAQEASQLPMTGIVVNNVDWAAMVGMKDADGRYLSGGPFGNTTPRLWGLPVVTTPIMPVGNFLVMNGAQAAQIFDRLETEILISSEHGENFARNQLTVRCEKRLAMVVKRPQALVFGAYPTP